MREIIGRASIKVIINKMPRKPSPDAAPYLRRVLGIPLNERILPANDLYRLEFAVAIVNFIGTENRAQREKVIADLQDNKVVLV